MTEQQVDELLLTIPRYEINTCTCGFCGTLRRSPTGDIVDIDDVRAILLKVQLGEV